MGKDIVLLKKNNESLQKRTDNLEKDIKSIQLSIDNYNTLSKEYYNEFSTSINICLDKIQEFQVSINQNVKKQYNLENTIREYKEDYQKLLHNTQKLIFIFILIFIIILTRL